MKTKTLFFTIMGVVMILLLVNLAFTSYLGVSLPTALLTGKGVTGVVQLLISGDERRITIHFPLNTTYVRDVGDSYIFDLNVSANYSVDEWQYSLYDNRHGLWISQNVTFSPNTTFQAVRWSNTLYVRAHGFVEGDWMEAEVTFYVSVPNSAPTISYIPSEFLRCEGDTFNFYFNATDPDEDTLVSDISPKNPFFTENLGRIGNVSFFRIFSGMFEKKDVGTLVSTISVDDQFSAICCVDTAVTNFTIIEINNPPSLQNIGAQTVWTRGRNSTFYLQLQLNDTESGNASSRNYSFNITFGGGPALFSIDEYGVMNYTPEEYDEGIYSIGVCANDTALSTPHPNISLCAPDTADSQTVCDTFSLTITDVNRPPEILAYTPNETALSMAGESIQRFSVNVTDPDGTLPDIDWYVGGVLEEHFENQTTGNYTYHAPCGFGGVVLIEAVTTDGLANDTINWTVTVTEVACFTPSSGGGGGGGGGGGASTPYCREMWGCEDWGVCLNAFSAHSSGELALGVYTELRELCYQNDLGEDQCGFRERTCEDVARCSNEILRVEKPSTREMCEYVEGYGCFDGIQNCHGGSCEVKIDCGGPCKACPTCSDGKKNQQEEGIDCGGPCPARCSVEQPSPAYGSWILLLLLLLIIAFAIIIWRTLDILIGKKGIIPVRKKEESRQV